MKIADHHVAALQAFGYTETEARFLYVVATHSGYFVPRQYLAFSGASWGYRTDHFLKKLESQGHVYWREYQGAGGVYHLFSKRLYAQIDKENLRNRRKHSTEFIKARLLLLDFIIAHLHHNYLETEQAKVAYFCEQLGLPKRSLPVKVYMGTSNREPTLRYFVDKYPLFFDASDASSSPEVTFSYVDPGYAGIAGFANHLNAYTPLLRSLLGFWFLYIANSAANFKRAEERFSALVRAPLRADVSTEALRYFQLRKAWEMKRYGLFSNEDIGWLNHATRRFQGEYFEGLYTAWFAGSAGDDAIRREFTQVNPAKQVQFATCLVNTSRLGHRSAQKRLKNTLAPHLRAGDSSLQPRMEANVSESKELTREEEAGRDAAKIG